MAAGTKIGSAYIDVKAESKGFEKSTKGFVSRTLSALGPLIAAFAAVFSVKALVNFTKGLRTAGERAATDSARIQQIAESMGLVAEGATGLTNRLVGVSQELSTLTGVEAGTVREAQALLLTFQNVASSADEVGGVFDRATVAAADLAAAGFGEVTGNATSLGIALNDPINGMGRLTRVGVTFTEAQKEQIKTLVESGDTLAAQDLLLQAIETQVGGVAAATANTSDRVRASWASVMERLGGEVLPLFDRFGNFIIDVVHPLIERGVGRILETITGMVAAFDDAESIPDGLLAAFSVLTGGNGIGSIFNRVSSIIQNVFTGIVDWLASGGITQIFQVLINSRERLFNAAMQLFPALIDAIMTVVPILLDVIINQVLPQTIDFILSGVPMLLDAALTLFTQLVEAVITILPDLLNTLVGTVLPNLLTTVLGMVPKLLTTALALFQQLVEAVLKILPQLLRTLLVVVLPQVLRTILQMLPDLLRTAVTTFTSLIDAVLEVLPELISILLTEVLPAVVETLIDMAPELFAAALEALWEITLALGEVSGELVSMIFTEVIPGIVDAILTLGPKLFNAGKEVLGQLWDGIREVANNLISWVQNNVVQKIVDLWPFSPAKTGPFRTHPLDRAGENIMGDLAKGISRGARQAAAAAAAAATQVSNAANINLNAGAVQISFAGNVSAAQAHQAGVVAAEAMLDRLSRARVVQ